MKKLLYFLKIVFLQNVIFIITLFVEGDLVDKVDSNLLKNIVSILNAFFISLGISGLLFVANALCVIFIEKKTHIYLMLTLNIILYVFVFFEYVLDISGAFRELLLPTVFGVYGGVSIVLFTKNNRSLK